MASESSPSGTEILVGHSIEIEMQGLEVASKCDQNVGTGGDHLFRLLQPPSDLFSSFSNGADRRGSFLSSNITFRTVHHAAYHYQFSVQSAGLRYFLLQVSTQF